MSKISNALTMLELLNNNRKYSINELAERLEVTPRMIRIYKQDLENAGIYIGKDRKSTRLNYSHSGEARMPYSA